MTRRTSIIAVGVLTIVAALLRVVDLNRGLWFDEILTLVEAVRPPFAEIVTRFLGGNNHPLYSVLAHMTFALLGEHVWSLRLPAVVFGVLGVPALYWLGTAITTRLEALLATTLLTVSYHHVWFSQNARGYTALLFFTMVATLLFVRLLQNPRTLVAVAFGVVTAFGMYTHLTMCFVVAAQAMVWGALAWRRHEILSRTGHARIAALAFGAPAALSVALYAPMLSAVSAFVGGPPQRSAAVGTPFWAVLETLKGLQIGFGGVGVIVALGLIALGTWSYAHQNRTAALLMVTPAIATVCGVILMSAPMRPRFFFSLLGFALLTLVRGAMEAGRLIHRRMMLSDGSIPMGVWLVGLMCVFSANSLRYNYAYPKQDFDGALQFIEGHRAAAEPVLTAGLASYPYTRYYGRQWIPIENPEQLEAHSRAERAWLVYSFPEYMAPGLLEGIRRRCEAPVVFRGTLGGGDVIVCTLGNRGAKDKRLSSP